MPKVTDYFRTLAELLFIELRNTQNETITTNRISFNVSYNELINAVAEKLCCDPAHVRLHIGDDTGDNPVPIKCAPTLREAINNHLPDNVATDGIILFVEITEMPVSELESMRRLHLTGVNNELEVIGECNLYVRPEDTPDTIFPRLNLPIIGPIRLIETLHHRVIRDYIANDMLGTLTEQSELYVEGPIADIELSPPVGYRLVSVFSYYRDPSRTHSRPFRFLLLPGEPFSLTRGRLLSRLGLSSSAYSSISWSFSLVLHGRARPIGDTDILASTLENGEQLGINRPDPEVVPTRAGGIEKSIKIRSSTPSNNTNTPK